MSYEGEIRTSHPKKENTRARNRSARLVSWLADKCQTFSVRETTVRGDDCQRGQLSEGTTVRGDNCQMFEFLQTVFS